MGRRTQSHIVTGQFDLVIRAGLVVTPAQTDLLDIGIQDGKIAALLRPGTACQGKSEIDASGLVITAGGIDTHTHIRWPHDGTMTVDDFYGATRAAVLSGTTTIIDFVPPGTGDLLERCRDRVDEALTGAVIDFAFHPILTSAARETIDSIDAVVRAGFTSFKMYTTYDDRRVDDGAAWQLMKAITASGGTPGFHAENHELLNSIRQQQIDDSTVSLSDFPASRPALAEAEAIQMVSLYARRLNSPVHIFHVSGAEALDSVRSARAKGTSIYAETCTHYLLFDSSVFGSEDAWKYVISPPLRERADRDELWRAIEDGTVTSVGSDHCAYDIRSKHLATSDYLDVPAGAPGIEARTPLLFSGAAERGLGLNTFAKINAERASKALGLFPRKGVISIGSDADLVLWDQNLDWVGSQAIPAANGTFSLYDDIRGTGRPKDVIVAGRCIVADGKFVGDKGSGRFLKRQPRTFAR